LFSGFEARKRMIASGADAQSSGVLALYYLQRDAQNAGYGLPLYNSQDPSPLLCPVNTSINQGGVVINLSPVVIVDGGAGQDIVRIRYGNPPSGGASVRAVGNLTAPALDGPLLGCQVGDVVLFHQTQTNPNCSLARIQQLNADRVINTLTEINTVPTDRPVANLNGTEWVRFSCLGVWNQYEYAVNANQELTRTGGTSGAAPFPNSAAIPVVNDIVSMQAQYGVANTPHPDPVWEASTTGSRFLNRVDQWRDATGAFGPAMVLVDRNRIRAIRIAIVARDGGLQRDIVSQACNGNAVGISRVCVWTNDAAPANVNLDHIPNWQRFRYRTFEVTVPLRNILWNRDAL
ncbi:MAG: PilW family protein, partial [Methylophilus sp.]